MNWYSKIYWLTRLDALNNLFSAVLLISGMVIFLFFLFSAFDGGFSDNEFLDKSKKWVYRLLIPVFITAAILMVFIPTKNEMILIIAGGKAGEFIEHDSSLNKIPGQSAEYLSKLLQEQIEKLEKEK